MSKARWWCHCCGRRNDPSVSNCSVCNRPSTYVAQLPMKTRPLHGGSADCIRFNQFEVLLDKDMKRDAARRQLLLNGGMEVNRLDAEAADEEEHAITRRCVDQLLTATDMSGKAVNDLRIGDGSSEIPIKGITIDQAKVMRALTGITGEKGAGHIARRFRENSDVCLASSSDSVTKVGYTSLSSGDVASASLHTVKEDKRKWSKPDFINVNANTSHSDTDTSSNNNNNNNNSIVKNVTTGDTLDGATNAAAATAFKQKALDRIHRLAKGIEKLEDPREALMKKAFIDTDTQFWTPLHVAAANGSSEIIASLLHGGALVEAKTRHGWRPLHLAAASGHLYAVSLLLKHPKSDPTWVTDAEKQSAFHLAARSDGPGGGISKKAAAAVVDEVLHLLLKKGCPLEGKNFMGRTPLMEAAYTGHARAVQKLINLGANVNAEDNEGWSSRQVAEFVGHKDVVEVIVNYLQKQHGTDKLLPRPSYHCKHYHEAKQDFIKGQKQAMRSQFRRETYQATDGPLKEWAMGIKFNKYMAANGAGESVFDYDRKAQREDYNRYYSLKNGGWASSESSVSGLSEPSEVNSITIYDTQPFSPLTTGDGGGVMTMRVGTADGLNHTQGVPRQEWRVRTPYDPNGFVDSAEEMKRTRDIRAMSRMDRRREFEKTMIQPFAAQSALLR